MGRLLFQDHRRELDDIDADQVMLALGGPNGLTERTSTFRRRDVVRAWCDRLPRGAPLETLERLTDATLDSEAGVAVMLSQPAPTSPVSSDVDRALARLAAAAGVPADESQPLRGIVSRILTNTETRPDELANELLAESLDGVRDPVGVLTWRARRRARQLEVRSDLTVAGAPAGLRPHREAGSTETVYSTHDLLETERRALEQASTAVATVSCEPTHVDRVLTAQQFLAEEQARMVRQITTGTEGVQVVVGRAGAGKTTALAAAVPLWRAAGCTVMGAALAARTAQQLGEETGMAAASVDGLLAELDTNPLRHNDVIVIDEAAMIGTRKLARLIDHTAAVGARLILVGDHHQLPEIDAGGFFRALTRHSHTVELVTNRRQQDPAERAAVNAIRDHNDAVALAHFTQPERYTVHDTSDQAVAAVVQGWWNDRRVGLSTTMLAGRQDQVDRLNAHARERLDEAGALYGPETIIGGTGYRVGDQILCLRNNRLLGVLNGTIATIDAITPDEVHATDAHGQAIVLPVDYMENGGLAHAYATTVQRPRAGPSTPPTCSSTTRPTASSSTSCSPGITEQFACIGQHTLSHMIQTPTTRGLGQRTGSSTSRRHWRETDPRISRSRAHTFLLAS
ncbi:AAA family ATPase [Euzebya rosea]|uniref:AAA family ATPase n=1 Tax=Euzebya rosea TaxID=2052804 RepID=UPI000D3E4185|nr:AAA family ATPase [Euzebya rosea]